MNDYAEVTDEELVGLVRSEDQELYRELVRRYQDKLLRYANYLVHGGAAGALAADAGAMARAERD